MILKRVPELRTGTKLDLAKLFKIKDPAELGRYLSKTKYAKLVPALPKNAGEKFDISLIETVLSKIKYKLAWTNPAFLCSADHGRNCIGYKKNLQCQR